MTWFYLELLLKNAVDVQLHQPLLSSSTTPDDVRLEMMSLCFQLETLCKKELTENSSIHQGHVSNSFIDRATVVYDRILHLLAKVPPDYQDCLRYLQSQRLDRLYPRAVTYLANPRSFSLDLDKTPLDSYFASVSTLSQLTTLARQMHNDCVNTSSHKYIAHQLALMYQTITQIKSPLFEQHKKGIEEMFKPIKATLATTDDKQIRCLTQSQQEWLLDLTNHILNTVNTFPADLTQDMVQPASVLQQKST
ncbi:uncharacterized protein LOC132731344 [Ruditapes philippinarum]|uniref:uncharacterized protein LOC132731344 n=1 Tax=Ruditapes philippinarum TaxID=129788 RepID=UPI00295AE92E|nr:uncharacterized protein LOC132731344 [Ruditapes philippinarum]